MKRFLFVIRGAGRASEALRAAVGAAGSGAAVRVALLGQAEAALRQPAAARHLATLEALGHEVRVSRPGDIPELIEWAEAVEVWR